jgi:hypothetical protein
MPQKIVPAHGDDLIPGVYNYCDRWCERCSLAERCLLPRTEQAIVEAVRGRPADHSAPSATAPVGPGGPGRPPDPELERDLQDDERRAERAKQDPLCVQAQGYAQLVFEWLDVQASAAPAVPAVAAANPPTPEEVIGHFCLYIPGKVYRAVEGALDEGAHDVQGDANGSAKAAMLAIRRSEAAWMALRPKNPASLRTAVGLVEVLGSLREGLERRFPRAQQFVRPGFDE